jgi:hypothetical protein
MRQQNATSLPKILKQIAGLIVEHGIPRNPPLTTKDPNAFRTARAQVLSLVSRAEELARELALKPA